MNDPKTNKQTQAYLFQWEVILTLLGRSLAEWTPPSNDWISIHSDRWSRQGDRPYGVLYSVMGPRFGQWTHFAGDWKHQIQTFYVPWQLWQSNDVIQVEEGDLLAKWLEDRPPHCSAERTGARSKQNINGTYVQKHVLILCYFIKQLPWPKKKIRPLGLCIKSEHCSYHAIITRLAIAGWRGLAETSRIAAPKRNPAWFFNTPS